MTGQIFDDKKDLFVPKYGVLPRLKATNGNIVGPDNAVLGARIVIQVLSWNQLWVVGPCAQQAPSELVKYSLDGENLDDGSCTIKEYVADLKAADWPNAASKEYYEVVATLLDAEKDSDLVGEMVQIQLSPTSTTEFDGYRLQSSFKIAQGLLDPEGVDIIEAYTDLVSAKGNTWTKLKFRKASV